MKSNLLKKAIVIGLTLVMSVGALAGCGAKEETSKEDKQVVIYSNGDEEAVNEIKATLDGNGYKDKYVIQTFGTSELGGKIMAEGKDIEADVITMSTFYIDSAQTEKKMFLDIDSDTKTLTDRPKYSLPLLGIEGALIINTKELESRGLPAPKSIKDLADPVYKGHISVVDIKGSSTAWLMMQALISEYGEAEAKVILAAIYKNAEGHLEESGSGPLKKVRAGEVAVGFGLRHQAVADKAAGKPIDYVDQKEGTFTLTESVAVVDKGDKTNKLSKEMANCIVTKARPGIIKYYPVPLYDGETADESGKSPNSKVFKEKLTVDLLKKHQQISEDCKAN